MSAGLSVNWFDLNWPESGWRGTAAPQQFDLGNKIKLMIINHTIYHLSISTVGAVCHYKQGCN